MPHFEDSLHAPAPPEEVWKLLYDPSRFPEWWSGMETVTPGEGGEFTMYPDGYPDFPMPQQLQSSHDDGMVKISCLVSDLVFEWRLEEADGGTRISVEVDIPEQEAHRLDRQRDGIAQSLANLAALAGA
jgi:uncharacterized protein YndB with AHSA1/START domain